MIKAKIIFTAQRTFYNHYRPVFKTAECMNNSCELIFINQEKSFYEKEMYVYIKFLCPELVKDRLQEGAKFELYEGPINVGYGIIIHVLL